MNKSSFRAYDIRGIVGENLLINDVYTFGLSLIDWLKKKHSNIILMLARDGRESSPNIYDMIYNAAISSNVEVKAFGVTSTPQLYFEAKSEFNINDKKTIVAVMITASHNDGNYNGFKILVNNNLLSTSEIQDLADFYLKQNKVHPAEIKYPISYPSQYLKTITTMFKELDGFSEDMIIDCSNGPTGQLINNICSLLNFKNTLLVANDIDQKFRCHRPDPTQEYGRVLFKNIKNKLGIAFDGDGDRLVVIDEDGNYVSGDKLLAIFALYSDNKKFKIVSDIKCSIVLADYLEKNNIETVWSKSGHGHIKEQLSKHDALIGGELSGHYCFLDKPDEIYGFDDAIYAFLRLIRIIKKHGPIKNILQGLPDFKSTGEMRIHIDKSINARDIVNIINEDIKKIADSYDTIDGIRAKVGNNCITSRASNTENLVSMSIEGTDLEEIYRLKNKVLNLINNTFEKLKCN